jgi:hypothetical protein
MPNGKAEHLADLEKFAGGNPIGAAFILLDLLKCQANFVREELLTKASVFAGLTQSVGDVAIDRRCLSFPHFLIPFLDAAAILDSRRASIFIAQMRTSTRGKT